VTVPLYHGTRLVAEISATPTGPLLIYTPDWRGSRDAFPVSVRMPLATAEASSEIVLPWLANLLPEGAALNTAGRWLGVDPTDVMGMMARIGGDVAGALSFGAPRAGHPPRGIPIPDAAALERIIGDLPRRPFLIGDDGVSMSLAGAQEKLPVTRLDSGVLAIPADGMPSTHILKPDHETRLYGAVHNEALCMVLARRVGLPVAEVTTGRAGTRAYLLVTRYDRARSGTGWVRLHQEDFCQALGKPPASKYQKNQSGLPGPTMKDMFEIVRRHAPGRSIARLLDATIFNVLICNTDAHAKNFSLLLTGPRSAELAPLYDLMCAAAWDGVTNNMAQEIGGSARGNQLTAKHWRRLARDAGTNATATLKRVETLIDRVETEVASAAKDVRAMPAGDHEMLPIFERKILERCRRVRANLSVDR
jgi:serine/threonine-protein kinase HipA